MRKRDLEKPVRILYQNMSNNVTTSPVPTRNTSKRKIQHFCATSLIDIRETENARRVVYPSRFLFYGKRG